MVNNVWNKILFSEYKNFRSSNYFPLFAPCKQGTANGKWFIIVPASKHIYEILWKKLPKVIHSWYGGSLLSFLLLTSQDLRIFFIKLFTAVWFTMQLCWELSIVWCIFNTHGISRIGFSPVFRRLSLCWQSWYSF